MGACKKLEKSLEWVGEVGESLSWKLWEGWKGGRDLGRAAPGAQGTDGLSMDNALSSGLFKGTPQMQLPTLGKSCFPGIAMDKRDGSSWQPLSRRSQLRQLW